MSDPGNNFPSQSQSPADVGSLAGAFRLILRKFLQNTDGMLPAKVIAVDDKREYVTVHPQIMVLGVDNTLTSRAQIAKVPLFNIGGGNYVLSFPIQTDDLGWIIAADRDISLYLQASKEAGPNTQRQHSFEDGLFVPDAARRWALDNEDTSNAVFQSLDGSVRIALWPTKVKITAPSVDVESPSVHMSGDLHVDGTIIGTTDVIGGGKSLKTHLHSGVTTGGGNTGPPT